MLLFDTLEELQDIISSLSADKYELMKQAANQNLLLSKNYNVIEDWMYKNILKDI